MSQELWQMLLLWLGSVNLVAFVVMGIDKGKARRDAWRLSEKMLFLPTVLGGALGGVLGMRIFHHKTRHWYFKVGFPALLIIQILVLGVCIWQFGT